MPVSLAALAACGPPWAVLRESGPPSALESKASVAVAFDRTETMVGKQTLTEYVSQREEKEAKFSAWLDEMEQAFVESMAAHANPIRVAAGQAGEVQLTVKVTWLQEGFYAHVASQPTVLRVQLEWRVGGQLADAIEYETQLQASITRASNRKRLLWCAEEAGRIAARFLTEKHTAPK
jgi:hypothetical protein